MNYVHICHLNLQKYCICYMKYFSQYYLIVLMVYHNNKLKVQYDSRLKILLIIYLPNCYIYRCLVLM